MNFTHDDVRKIYAVFCKYTNATKAYEHKIITSLLGFDVGIGAFRFHKGTVCPCGREISNLDYFLTGVSFHGLEFIRNQCAGFVFDEKNDVITIRPPELNRGFFGYICLNCGEDHSRVNHAQCTVYSYKYLVPPDSNGRSRVELRMNQFWLEKVLEESGVTSADSPTRGWGEVFAAPETVLSPSTGLSKTTTQPPKI